jgi:hypothetical protein
MMKQNRFLNFIRPTLLLAGAFTFAFLWGEMVHEFGHYFSHLAFGNQDAGVYLNPFGSSHITGVTSLPIRQMGITSAAGPLTDLILAVLMMFILWRKKQPAYLPFLLWGPVAMIQEGVNFSFGLLTPGGDAGWIATLGIPKPVLLISGVLLLTGGLVILTYLLISRGIAAGHSRIQFFLMILLGMCTLMVIRFVYSLILQPDYIMEDLIPLVFSLLLAGIVVLIQPVVIKIFNKGLSTPAQPLKRSAIITAVILGSGIFLFQILYSVYL